MSRMTQMPLRFSRLNVSSRFDGFTEPTLGSGVSKHLGLGSRHAA